MLSSLGLGGSDGESYPVNPKGCSDKGGGGGGGQAGLELQCKSYIFTEATAFMMLTEVN